MQIGWVIVGGMSLDKLLTLFAVPTVCSLMGRIHIHAHVESFPEMSHATAA